MKSLLTGAGMVQGAGQLFLDAAAVQLDALGTRPCDPGIALEQRIVVVGEGQARGPARQIRE